MLFLANLLSWFLAIGWWFSSSDRWEPAIVFVGLSVALLQQIRLRFKNGEQELSGGQKKFVLAIIFAALAVTRPSEEAHLGALMKSESDRAASRFVENMRNNGYEHKDIYKAVGEEFGSIIGPYRALSSGYMNLFFISVSEGHSTSIGIMGYVVVINDYPQLLSSFEGERYLAQFLSRFDEWRKKQGQKTQIVEDPASTNSK